MLVAVTLGVITSVRASLGSEGSAYPNFKWWIVNRLAFLVGANNLASFTVYFLQGRLGYVQSEAAGPGSKLTMFVGIFILVAALPSGWLTDKFGRKPMVIAAGLLAALGTAIALSIPSLTVIYIGGCFIGAGMGLFYTANWALGTEIVPREQAGRYLGISNLAGAGAGAIGAYIGGPIADFITAQVPSTPGIGYVTLFVIYGLLFLLSIIPLFMIKLPKAS
jgi:MFS family permease